jgi:hypothetical protein
LTPDLVVHVLRHGKALCAFMPSSLPRDWPKGHSWVGLPDIDEATCDPCVARGRELLQRSKV